MWRPQDKKLGFKFPQQPLHYQYLLGTCDVSRAYHNSQSQRASSKKCPRHPPPSRNFRKKYYILFNYLKSDYKGN